MPAPVVKPQFNAVFMSGYNNPEIEIVTLIMDNNDNLIIPPTHADVSKILRRGVVPFLAITNPTRRKYSILPLSFDGGQKIIFSCITAADLDVEDSMTFLSVTFFKDTSSPVVRRVTWSPSTPLTSQKAPVYSGAFC